MRLANTVGTRINVFDNLEEQTVATFNNLFVECPIKNKCALLPVSIGEVSPNNCRMITVDGETFQHKMYSDLLYTLDKQDYFNDETDKELIEINGTLV